MSGNLWMFSDKLDDEDIEIMNGRWVSTRIEMGNDWYLVGVDTDDLVGLIVRI